MNDEKKVEQAESMVQCPVCNGEGILRGHLTHLPWFDCGLCAGAGKVTKRRLNYWQERNTTSSSKTMAAL